MTPSSGRRRLAFSTLHQAACTLRADPVRSLGERGRAGGQGLRLPFSRDAAHAFAPRALRDPVAAVATDSASRRRASSRSLLVRTRVEIDGRGHGPGTGVVVVVGEWTNAFGGRLRGWAWAGRQVRCAVCRARLRRHTAPELGTPNEGTARHRRPAAAPFRSARTVTAVGARPARCRRYVIQLTLEACRGVRPDTISGQVRVLNRRDRPIATVPW